MDLDINDSQKIWEISLELYKKSTEYAIARKNVAENKHTLDIFLAIAMPELRKLKSNLGYETALIMLLEWAEKENNQTIKSAYEYYLKEQSRADGLDKILDALKTQISLYQSIVKVMPK